MSDAEKDLLQRIRSRLMACEGWDSDRIASDREKALNMYLMRRRGDEIPGRSQVVAGNLSAAVEATLAQMMEAFGGERIAEFKPYSQADTAGAQLETDACQKFIMEDNNGFLITATQVKDALLLRNGFGKAFVETRTRIERKSYEDVEPEALPALTQVNGAVVQVTRYDPDAATLQTKETHTRRVFRNQAVAPENFLYDPEHNDPSELQTIGFCAERHVDTRSDLVELFPEAKAKISKLKAFSVSQTTPTDQARNPGKIPSQQADRALDPSQDRIEWFECYALMDRDGDGIAERRRLCVAGINQNSLLSDEPRRLVPYYAGIAFLMPHKLRGMSLYDKLKQEDDIGTALERALLDAINAAIRNRVAYLDGVVNQEDVDDPRINAGMRVKGSAVNDVRAAVMNFQVPDMSGGILAAQQQRRTTRSELGGASLDLATANMQLNDRLGSQGFDRAYSAMERLAQLMTKLVAASLIRGMYLLTHATLREEWRDSIEVEAFGQWKETNPRQWRERLCVKVRAGQSQGERSRIAATMEKGIAYQIALADKGMDEVLVTADGFYALLMDWMRISDVPMPQRYWRDPATPEAKQAADGKSATAKATADLQKAFMAQAVHLEQMREALDKYKHDSQLGFDKWKEKLLAEIEEAKIIGPAAVKLLLSKTGADDDGDEDRPDPKPAAGKRTNGAAAAE